MLSEAIRDGFDYEWESQVEKKIWTEVAKDLMSSHLDGKKSIVSEACFRACTTERSTLMVESAARLNEGLFGGLADMVGGGLAKTFGKAFGGVKSRNWWIFGGGGEAETKKYRDAYLDSIGNNQEVFSKLGTKTLNNLETAIQETMPEFPNGGSAKDFTDAMSKFVQYYESIRLAAGAKTTEGEEPDKDQPPKLSVDDANTIIKKMRTMMDYYDRELLDRYTVNLESRTRHVPVLRQRRVPTLSEAFLFEQKDEKKDEPGIGEEGRVTASMKYLKSNTAPLILGALGLGTAAAGLFVQSQFFKDLFTIVQKQTITNPGSPEIPDEYAEKIFGNVTKENGSRGFVEFLNKTVPGAKLKFSDSPEKMLQVAGSLVGKQGDASAGAQALKMMHSSGVMGKGAGGFDKAVDTLLSSIKDGSAPKSVMDMTKGWGSGTHKVAGDLFQLDVGKIKGTVLKAAGKAAVEGSTSTVVTAKTAGMAKAAAALGPWGVGIGVGLIASAAAIKSLRSYGAKNSRASYIQASRDMMVDLKPGDVPDPEEQVPEQPPYVPPPAAKGKVVVEIDDKCVKVVVPKDVVESGGFEIRPSFRLDDVPIGNKEKAREEVIDYLNSIAGKKSVSFAKGASAKEVEDMDFDVKDNRTDPKKKKDDKNNPTAPGKGRPAVVSIKDHRMPSLTSYLFEDADLRIVPSDKAKTKHLKDLKKTMSANPKNMPLPPGASTVEKDVMTKFLQLTDKDFELKAAPGDAGVLAGLDAIRKKLKTGNVILTFSTKTIAKLKTFGIDDDAKRKMILQVYSKNPQAAPATTSSYNVLIKKFVPSGKRDDFCKLLVDMGMAKKVGKIPEGGPADDSKEEEKSTATKAKKKGKTTAESFVNDNDVIMERWNRLAGLEIL